MKLSSAAGIVAIYAVQTATAFSPSSNAFPWKPQSLYHKYESSSAIFAEPPPGGLSFEEDKLTETNTAAASASVGDNGDQASTSQTVAALPSSSLSPFQDRGKLNEIDFCVAPTDVSLSRLYQSFSNLQQPTSSSNPSKESDSVQNLQTNDVAAIDNVNGDAAPRRIISLTRALNNASNRAVRRILLSRSWPSPEALNLSLRQVLAANRGQTEASATELKAAVPVSAPVPDPVSMKEEANAESSAKCPVPRPILNIIMKEQLSDTPAVSSQDESLTLTDGQAPEVTSPTPLSNRGKTDEAWVASQIQTFRDTYGQVQGYDYAEAYMECILSLATSGVESEKVKNVMNDGIYDDSYRRMISVLRSAGVIFEIDNDGEGEGDITQSKEIEDGGGDENDAPVVSRMKIAKKLKDQDICLSMLDKINIKNGMSVQVGVAGKVAGVEKQEQLIEILVDNEELNDSKVEETTEPIPSVNGAIKDSKGEQIEENFAQKFLSWITKKDEVAFEEAKEKVSSNVGKEEENEAIVEEEIEEIKPEDLGGVLLSKEEPTITRQLNILSNIVERTLLFGGDQEILVLSKTLEADKPAFIKQWFPDTVGSVSETDAHNEKRPEVKYFNCLVQLLNDCYDNGMITSLDPPLPLTASYANSYQRLTAMLAELGSGYVKPINSKILLKKPQNPKEELIRFSQWEVALRQTQPDVSDIPSDLVGSWQVKDQIGGKVIGTSTVVFKPDGVVEVPPPLRGLQWRLDPGPTHLDTCTFQVLSEDGAILQYRGFMDRGARLESRFSKRSIKIRGAVSFQMRDSTAALIGENYKRDLLPIDTLAGTTRFVMSKVFDLND